MFNHTFILESRILESSAWAEAQNSNGNEFSINSLKVSKILYREKGRKINFFLTAYY